MSGPSLRLHVERLVLEGLEIDAHGRPLLQAALEAELGRLLAQRGLAPELAAGGAFRSLRGGTLQAPADRAPQALGERIAQAVGTALSPAEGRR